MKLDFSLEKEGIKVKHEGSDYRLSYPKEIWRKYPKKSKQFLFDNLAHLLTINSALVKGEEQVEYNTSFPLFKSFFDKVVLNSLPHAVDDYPVSTFEMMKQFFNTEYNFKDLRVKRPFYRGKSSGKKKERAIISLSCGKDSLLSLGLARELGLEPIGVYINDTVSPPENKIKLEFLGKIARESGLRLFKVANEMEKLNDFETWGKEESCVGYTHMMTGFSLMVLPFNYYFNAGYTVVGNQANMNFKFLNADGFWTYPSFDQSRKWMKQQNIMLGLMTEDRVKLVSLIEGLTNLAIMKILHGRYKNLGKYQVSCDCLDYSVEKRWCHDCNKCCRLYLMMKAVGAETKTVGFHKDLLKKEYEKHYSLFGGKEVDAHEKSVEAREEQLFCFYLAEQRGVKGELVELFREKFSAEAEKRVEELRKKFLGVGGMSSVPGELKEKLRGILEEELGSQKI